MSKKAAILGFAVICFSAIPVFADSLSSNSSLKIGDVSLSINNSRTVLTKTQPSTGKWLGEQKFQSFGSMMWVQEHNVLFVAGVLEGGNKPVLLKIKGTGGGGQNMLAVTPNGDSSKGYNYRLGSQLMSVQDMSYQGNLLQIRSGSTTYQIKNVGGGGNNMFALVNNTECKSMPGYNYFIQCVVK
jgi:hypothetical protein